MTRKAPGDHFDSRKEWTKRKHVLLGRYVRPAVAKLSRFGTPVCLVDGFAGANAYGDEAEGSTAILCREGTSFGNPAQHARVFACEPIDRRFASLQTVCGAWLDSGVLTAYNATHASSVAAIQSQILGKPAVVFLDPMKNTDFSLEKDVLPWALRAQTDVLGLFFHGQACRTVSGYAHNHDAVHPSTYLGARWAEATTEPVALQVFLDAISGIGKKFAAVYPLRKLDQNRVAYAIFALSDSEHGMWLFSNAIAQDLGVLDRHDIAKTTGSLFREAEGEDQFEDLISFMRPHVRAHPDWDTKKLGPYLLKQDGGLEALFGKYSEKDVSRARRLIKEEVHAQGD